MSCSRTDSATRPPEGCDLVELALDLFKPPLYTAVEIKSQRAGTRRELACRWCGRRGYHLTRCPRAAALRDVPELELRARYLLELVIASSRTAGVRMR